MKKPISKWVLGHRITPIDVSGNYDMVLGETPANVPGPPPHFHEGYNEVFLVTKGEMEFMTNGEVRTVRAGDSVDLPPKTLHTFRNVSNAPCEWVNIHSPKGFMAFFDQLGVKEHEVGAIEASVTEEKIQEVMRTAESFDMHIRIPQES
ncbi:MAG: cupin domain-containing protein [Flavobacteriales bacterium]|nr:cupin domain-containing protein [Flavobacteriales bacterium]